MVSSRILFPQFRDEQSASKYPFADHASLIATNTGIKIPHDLFVDASFFGIGTGERLYISSITITNQTATIIIGDLTNANKMSAAFDVTRPPDNGVLQFFDAYNRPAGILVAEAAVRDNAGAIKKVSPLTELSAWSPVQHRFSPATAEFVASVVIPAKEPGVRALTTADSADIHTGDIWLVGNAGVVVRAEGADVIRIDVIGVPLFKRLICAPQTDFPTKNFLRTINGCGPDEYGNFTFTATDKAVDRPVVRVYPANNALNFDTLGPQVS